MRKRVLTVDFAITLGFFVLAALVLNQARTWPFRARLFPLAAGVLLFVLALLKIVLDLASSRRAPAAVVEAPPLVEEEVAEEAEMEDVFVTATRFEWLSSLAWMGLFFAMLWFLGALVTVPLFAVIYLLVASRESPVMALGYGVVAWVFVYGLFDRLLHIPLPASLLFPDLGW